MEDGRPYRFANELICGRIAQFLLLPVPPFGFTYFPGQKDVPLEKGIRFSEVDFNCERRESYPLPDFDACIDHMPMVCTGILAFDILIANPDRRRDHLWCDNQQHPTRLLMFDHDFALFGPNAGITRLDALQDALGLGDTKQDNSHPFLTRLRSADLLDEWCARIYSLHAAKWFIKEVCREAEKYGLSRSEANAAAKFIEYRSSNLDTIIKSHRPLFERVSDWSKGLFT
jgi:hypothetical protein